MDSAQVFNSADGYLPLWETTWKRISTFLPTLQEEFLKAQSSVPKSEEIATVATEVLPHESVLESNDYTNPVIHNQVAPSLDKRPENELNNVVLGEEITEQRPTSIILQPPAYNQTYTTPIFNHTGQQVCLQF